MRHVCIQVKQVFATGSALITGKAATACPLKKVKVRLSANCARLRHLLPIRLLPSLLCLPAFETPWMALSTQGRMYWSDGLDTLKGGHFAVSGVL